MAEILGVIGGSGLYAFEGLEVVEERVVETPFGAPSDALIIGRYKDRDVVFLPRHGRGHRHSPSTVPYRANIFALKSVGVTRIVSVSAVGSMKEEIEPGHLVFPDQFMDRTVGRERTFFDDEIVAHVTFADPICGALQKGLIAAAGSIEHHVGGAYVCIEGPQFSTRAESNVFRSWGVAVIGMTNLPEARLAREAEMCYATVAMATDYDCWHTSEEDVSVEAVLATLKANVGKAQDVIRGVLESDLPVTERTCPCATALEVAIMTDRELIPARKLEELRPLVGRVLGS